ncbi:hypothetical protein [Aestuariibacter sp. A3R04]|uniref:hypothetical protein n=1 Tax=Aestuariibacter sp. A3R04 TaxID=2841571 RepID=UPI001C086360|nr:hypothetical protein [Aestuariibacter sp. A3R04]MBU3021116.1 hypothetical protein [Aestuariibacter sp. A3R04]
MAVYTGLLAVTLPLPRPDAVLLATMLGFVIFCAVVIVAFKLPGGKAVFQFIAILAGIGCGGLFLLEKAPW